MTESKYSPRRIEAIDKQRQALELRAAGRTWVEIAKALGYADHSGAYRAVTAALERTLKEPADRLRALTLERLTVILRTLWPRVLSGELAAMDRVLKVMAATRSLMGLDAPVQHEVSGRDGAPLEVAHTFRSELVDQMTEEQMDATIADIEAMVRGQS